MVEEPEKPAKPFWKRYTWSLTKNDLLDFLPDQIIRCTDLRDNYYECADRVGLMRSNEFCTKYLADLRECRFQYKQRQRMKLIMQQRKAQNRPAIEDTHHDHHKKTNGWNTERM